MTTAALVTFSGQVFEAGRTRRIGVVGELLDSYKGRGVCVKAWFDPRMDIQWYRLRDEQGGEFDVSYRESITIAGMPLRTTAYVAELLGVTQRHVSKLAGRMKVGVKIGRDLYFTSRDVAAMEARRTEVGRPPGRLAF